MMNRPRRQGGAALAGFAALMLAAWIGLVFVARALAESEKTAGFGAFLGFMVIAMSVVAYVLFMMAVDSDKG